ncbi:hypothetical protein GCM10009764_81500 [Nocardia ninae]|uniref:Uncharacterized protein n=1 Tax=Nocardia ninae NBRC 108245 TaxID=1210091 RepID=A0A511MJI2_9NOCA|nr:hypothetical protein NN4_53210 [Nocardia ninae NBRC 108245]
MLVSRPIVPHRGVERGNVLRAWVFGTVQRGPPAAVPFRVVLATTIECAGSGKPACIAESIVRALA